MMNIVEMKKVVKVLQGTAKRIVTPNVKAWLQKSQEPVTSEEEFVSLMREFTKAMYVDGIW